MTIATLRPNATLNTTGSGQWPSGSTPHAVLSDSSDSTYFYGVDYVNNDSSWATGGWMSTAQVGFTDATGTVPAGRTITRVRFGARLYTDGTLNAAAASLRFSDDLQAAYLVSAGASGTTNYYSSWFTTAPRGKGAWTYALVDGLKAIIGTASGVMDATEMTYEVWIEVEYTDAPAVPTAVIPASAASVTTATPTLGATLSAITSGQTQHAEWQLATDSGFTASLRTVTEAAGDNRASGATTEPCGARLAPGVWYIRARAVDQYGLAGGYSATQSFTVAHVPSASGLSPAGGGTSQYAATTALSWVFSDASPSDAQTAYQVIIERNDNGAAVLDTTKVVSSSTAASVAISTAYKDIQLRWKVRVWDTDDTASAYSSYAVFTLADAPVVTITSPADGGSVATGAPTFAWTAAIGGTRTPSSTVVTVKQTSNNSVVWTTTLAGAIYSATPPSTILVNGVNYSVTVAVTDTAGMFGTDTNLFTTSYVSPGPIEYNISDSSNSLGYVRVDWTTAPSDSRLVYWRVYRRELPSAAWELIYQIGNEAVRHYDDYLLKSSRSYMYCVTQVADRSGITLESPVGTRMLAGSPTAEARITPVSLDNYWMIVPDRPELTMLIPNVISDPSSLDFEDATYNLIGRGRHRDYGDELGLSGTLTFQVRQPEVISSVRAKVEDLRRARETYWLRTPFGRLIQVALGNLGWTPIAGTGTAEMGDMTIPYEEVA